MEFVEFDSAYVARLAARDRVAEAHFVSYFSELITMKLRSRVSSKDAIEDIRQETFVRVLTLLRGGELRQPASLGALVNSICNHVLQEHYRSGIRREATLDDETRDRLASPDTGGFGARVQSELQTLVSRTLTDLPERDRNLLRSVLLEERDKDEVCRQFGVSREHLRVLVHRAKRSFKDCYINHLGLPPNQDGGVP